MVSLIMGYGVGVEDQADHVISGAVRRSLQDDSWEISAMNVLQFGASEEEMGSGFWFIST